MAVTQIRKYSSWVLAATAIVSIIVVALFFFGGNAAEQLNGRDYPRFTNLLLNWTYFVSILAVVVGVGFALLGFLKAFQQNARRAMLMLASVVALILLFVITYFVGSTDTLMLNEDMAKYNVPSWLRFADMCIGSIYVLFAAVVGAVLWGTLRKVFMK